MYCIVHQKVAVASIAVTGLFRGCSCDVRTVDNTDGHRDKRPKQLVCGVELFEVGRLEAGSTDVQLSFTTRVAAGEQQTQPTKQPLNQPPSSVFAVHVLHAKQLAALHSTKRINRVI